MRSNLLAGRPRLRRILPWALWLGAAAVAVPMGLTQAGIGSSPAVIDTHIAALAPMRTDHRLRVAKIHATPGQLVKAGDLLVEMDTTEIDAEIAVAQAKLLYIEITSGWQQSRLADNRARTSHALATTAERTAVDVARIIAEAERDRSALTQLDLNLEAEQKLVTDQLAGAERLRALKLERAALAKKVDEYKEAVSRVRKSADGSTRRLGQWRDAVTTPPEGADLRTAACEVQRREIGRMESLRKAQQVRAPFDGRVGEIMIREGELSADPGIPVLTLIEETSSVAIAYLDQRNAQRVRVGDVAKLVPRDLSGAKLGGRVVALAPSITEIPVRFRRVPTLHEFGRNVYIRLDAPATLPGQAYDAVFRGGGRP
jgi:multidrug resistance efflux pump